MKVFEVDSNTHYIEYSDGMFKCDVRNVNEVSNRSQHLMTTVDFSRNHRLCHFDISYRLHSCTGGKHLSHTSLFYVNKTFPSVYSLPMVPRHTIDLVRHTIDLVMTKRIQIHDG